MGVSVLKELKKKAAGLTPEENLELIAHLLNTIRTRRKVTAGNRKWREIYGKASYPLTGEDAQTWVTRTRKESDEQREKQWK